MARDPRVRGIIAYAPVHLGIRSAPGQGRRVTALHADGNIGIGGYPDDLLPG